MHSQAICSESKNTLNHLPLKAQRTVTEIRFYRPFPLQRACLAIEKPQQVSVKGHGTSVELYSRYSLSRTWLAMSL